MTSRFFQLCGLAGFSLVLLHACGGRAEEEPSGPDRATAPTPGPCGETPGHTPTKSENQPCAQEGLVCGPYKCVGKVFRRMERCLTSVGEIGMPCRVAPGYSCTLVDHCGGVPSHGTPYRGYECLDGKWKDVTSIPCPDAGTDDEAFDASTD